MKSPSAPNSVVHHVRVGLTGRHGVWETDLSAMAADPEMQRELKRIDAEFSAAEADGDGIPLLPTPFTRSEPLGRPACGQGLRRSPRKGRKWCALRPRPVGAIPPTAPPRNSIDAREDTVASLKSETARFSNTNSRRSPWFTLFTPPGSIATVWPDFDLFRRVRRALPSVLPVLRNSIDRRRAAV